MPWKEANALKLRSDFIRRALREEMPFAQLCREYGISTKTGYKWKERFLCDGMAGLADLSRRPHNSATHIGEDVVCELVRLKNKHLQWGPDKIRQLYANSNPHLPLPSLSSVKRLLAKCGLVQPRPKRRPAAKSGRIVNRVQATAPNHVWTVDFKGWWYSTHNEKVLPLTVCDAFGRFVLAAQIVADASTATVKQCFIALFSEYGLPLVIRSDNGAPFASMNAPLGLSRLSAWWVWLGIGLDRIAPGHPEQNGSHERMHREIAIEVEGKVDGDLAAQQAALDIWRREYNHERPHRALGNGTPASVYIKSERRYDPQTAGFDYPLGYLRRKITQTGRVKIENRLIQVSTAVSGFEVGLQPLREHVYKVWLGMLCLGELNTRDEKFTVVEN